MENADVLIGSGLTVPLSLVTLDDKDTIIEVVSLHHVLLNSKAEMVFNRSFGFGSSRCCQGQPSTL